MQILPDLNRYGEYYATNEEYIRQYRYTNAFHPFHGFSMISSAHIAEKNTADLTAAFSKLRLYFKSLVLAVLGLTLVFILAILFVVLLKNG